MLGNYLSWVYGTATDFASCVSTDYSNPIFTTQGAEEKPVCFRGDPPEELQWPEHHNEVERLHVEGQSNQAQKGEHRDGEVKPEQRSQTNSKSTKTLLIEI